MGEANSSSMRWEAANEVSGLEAKLGHELQADAPREFAAQEALMLLEMLDHVVSAFAAEREHEHGCELQVRRHPHLGHRERIAIEHVVDDLAAGKDLGQGVADQLAHFQLALARRLTPVAIGHHQSRLKRHART